MKHSNLYLGLVLPSGGWQSLIKSIFIKILLDIFHFEDKHFQFIFS